jgi:hypothetical protein
MIGTGMRGALVAAVGCLLLTGCGPAKPSATATSTASAAAVSTAAPAAAKGGGLTACGLVTEQDAKTVIGNAAGTGTAGGTAALSECIYGEGALVVSMKTDGKALYDTSHAAAHAKGATELSGVGDSAFEAGTDQHCTLLLLKGTTLVSILFGGPDAQHTATTVAKIAASRL